MCAQKYATYLLYTYNWVCVCKFAIVFSCGFPAITPNNNKNCYRITKMPTFEKTPGRQKIKPAIFTIVVFFLFGFLRNLQQIEVSCACLPKPNTAYALSVNPFMLVLFADFCFSPLTLMRQAFNLCVCVCVLFVCLS